MQYRAMSIRATSFGQGRGSAVARTPAYIERPDLGPIRAALRTPLGSIERHRVWEDQHRKASEAREQLPKEFSSLTNMVRAADGLKLLGAAHALDSIRRSRLPGEANFGSDAMLELLAGVVASTPEVDLLPNIDALFHPQLIFALDTKLREIANLIMQDHLMAALSSDSSEESGVLGLLRLEHSFDRMSGFDTNLQRVAREVLTPLDDLARTEVGFALTDSLRFADLYGLRRMHHADMANEWLSENYPRPDTTAPESRQLQWAAAHTAAFAINSAPPLELELNEEIATALGVSEDSFEAMVRAMSTTVGSADVTSYNAENPTRIRPILALSTDEWLWPRPIDFVHGIFDWVLAVASSSGKLRAAFDKSRQRVAERLPAELLTGVFGGRVHSNVRYPAEESETELDVLVSLPKTVLLVECKGGRFSPQGRRGAPLRVARHADELVAHASAQNRRAATAIAAGKTLKSSSGRPLAVAEDAQCLSLVVTFDRVDPFSAVLGAPADGDKTQRAWVIALADLVMLTEILTTPADFYAYAKRRLDMLRDEEVLTWVESDALGAWCLNRLTKISRVTTTSQAGSRSIRMLSETSSWMNDYYALMSLQRMGLDEKSLESIVAMSENRQAERRPQAEVPEIVRAALDRLLASEDEAWSLRAEQAFEVPPPSWRGFGRLVDASSRTASGGGRKARKRAAHASSGTLVGGRLPIRVAQDGAALTDPDHLILVPDPHQ